MLLKADIEEFCMGLERDGCPRAAATLQHFYTLFREREEQSAIIGRLRDGLLEARAVLADHHDIEDGGGADEHPHQVPNWAMRATNLLDELEAEIPRELRLANPTGTKG